MQTPGRFVLFLCVPLLVAALGPFLPAHAHSQTPPASQPEDSDAAVDNDDDKPVSFLAVSITLDPSGKATAQANYLLDDEGNLPPAEIKEALESALNCSLENSPRVRPMPGNYSGSCTAPTSARRFLHEGRISTASLQEFARLHNITSSALQLHLPDSDILETLPPIPHNSATPAKTPASLIGFMRTFFL